MHKSEIGKIALGTVQFGLDYGQFNKNGVVNPDEVEKIINFARIKGIKFLDTAHSYGTSEQVLGKNGVSDFKIVTKFSKVNKNGSSLFKSIKNAHNLLNVRRNYGYLAHNAKVLLSSDGQIIFNRLKNLKDQNLIEKIGVSVYEPTEARSSINKYNIDLIQIPFNIFDNRWDSILNEMKDQDIEIHARSIFLQGLALEKKNCQKNLIFG